MRRRAFALALTAALAVVLAGCGEDPQPAAPTPAPTATPQVTDIETATPEETPAPEGTPTPESQIYTVEQGDTLGVIAQRFGTTVEAIVEANDLENPDQIFVGDELEIPSG
ncbi:MAG TPA: LysM domain-containing protein [Egibacteraceae bacterium]|nr:LysM domain-containing protein [Egibacteraceae bacterium]